MKKLFLFFIFSIFSIISFGQKSNNYVLAESYFRNGDYEKAEKMYEKLLQKSPYNTIYLSKLTKCYQELKKFDVAEQLLKNKLKQKPNAHFLYVFLGYNFERQESIKEAEKHYDKAISSIDKKSTYGTTIASEFKKINKLDYTVKAYEAIMKSKPNANYGLQIAQIYGEKGEFEQMFEEFINYVDKNDKHIPTVKRYTSKYISNDSDDENNILFKKALLRKSASNPKNAWNNLLSWLFTKQKQYGKAFIQEKALYVRNGNNISKIVEIGDIAFENKDYDTAKECFDFVFEKAELEEDKFNAIYMNLLIGIETKEENIDSRFQEVFQTYGFNKKTLPIQLAYANYLTFQKANPEKAYTILEEAIPYAANEFQKARVKMKMGEVLVYQEKFNKALIYFSQVQTKLKNNEIAQQARYKVAQTSYFKNDFEWAKAQLKVLKGSTTQLIANDAAHLFVVISDNQPKDSIATGLSKYAKADLLHLQNKNDEAVSILNEVLQEYAGQEIEDEALYQQAKIFTQQQKFEDAINNYNKIIADDAYGVFVDDAYYHLAEIYNNEFNDSQKASEHYQKIIFDYPSSIYLVEARRKFRKLRGDSI